MTLKERDVVLTSKDDKGNDNIDLPITRWNNIEDRPEAANDEQISRGDEGLLYVTPKQLQVLLLNLKVKVMNGATAAVDGEMGLVPKPPAGSQSKFLTGAGTYEAVTVNKDDIVASALNSVPNVKVAVSSSAQSTMEPSVAAIMPSTYTITVPNVTSGIQAGTYTILDLIQRLINLSHGHTSVTKGGTNCTNSCTNSCTDGCGDTGCGDGGGCGG